MSVLRKTIVTVLAAVMILSLPLAGGLTASDLDIFGSSAVAASSKDEYKIVLTWGSDPKDLDSHLEGYYENGSSYHVFYSDMTASYNGNTVAQLDIDERSSYGPETVVFTPSLTNKEYFYYVHNYSGTGDMSDSRAHVELFRNGNLIGSYNVPSGGGSNGYWNIFKIVDGNVYMLNTFSSSPDSSGGSMLAPGSAIKSNTTSASSSDVIIAPYGRKWASGSIDAEILSELTDRKLFSASASNYLDLKGVTLARGSKTEKNTENNFNFVIPAAEVSGNSVTLSYKGYRDYIIPKSVMSSWSTSGVTIPVTDSAAGYLHNAFMSLDKKDGKPYISTVFGCKDGGYYSELRTSSLSVDTGEEFSVIVTAGGTGGKDCTYYLEQDSTRKSPGKKDGIFHKSDLSSFVPGKTVYAYAKTDAGKVTEPVEVKISIAEKPSISSVTNFLSNSQYSILGKNFAKITIPDDVLLFGGAELSFEAFKFPAGFELDPTENTLKISVGANIWEHATDLKDTSPAKYKEWSTSYFKDWKSVVKKSTYTKGFTDAKKAKGQYKKIKDGFYEKWHGKDKLGNFKKGKSKNWDIDVLGYIEFEIINNNWKVKEACLTLEGKFTFKYTVQGSVWIIPAYTYIEAGASVGLSGNGARYLCDSDVPLEFNLSLNIEPNVTLGAGAGVKDFASLGLYANATLPIHIEFFSPRHVTVDLNGEIGAEAQFLIIKGKKKLIDGSLNIVDTYFGKWKKNAPKLNSPIIKSDNELDLEYEVVDRSYLASTSQWLGGRQNTIRKTRGLIRSEGMQLTTLQQSVFDNAQPQVVSFGDKMLMTWIQDDGSRDEYNRMRLMYSIYDGSRWSEPLAVYDDGCNDNAPVIVSNGTDVFFAWQKANRALTAEDCESIDAVVPLMEMYIAKYDSGSNSITDVKRLTDDSVYDYSPCLTTDNGNAVVYWTSCDDNQISAGSSHTIHRYAFGGTSSVVKSGINYIIDMAASGSKLSFSTDTDGDTATTADITVYTLENGSMSEYAKPENSETVYSNCFYGRFNGQDTLFVSDMQNIYYTSDGTVHSVFAESRNISGNINYIANGSDTYLLWTEAGDVGNVAYSTKYENGSWSEPIQISKTGSYLSNVDATLYNGRISGVCMSEVLEELSGSNTYNSVRTDLCSFGIDGVQDVSVDSINIEQKEIKKGEACEFTAYVTNHGSETVKNLKMSVSDGLGFSSTTEVSTEIASGATVPVYLSYTAPSNYGKTELAVKVECEDIDDSNSENDSASVEIGTPQITMAEGEVCEFDDSYIITALVTNESDVAAENVKVSAVLNDPENEAQCTETITLGARETATVQFTVQKNLVEFDDLGSGSIFFRSSIDSAVQFTLGVVVSNAKTECAHSITTIKVTDPTCTEDGSERTICAGCGELISTKVLPGGHIVENGACTRCGIAVESLSLNSLTKIDVESDDQWHEYWFAFTPDTDGYYYFYSDSAIDPNAALYSSLNALLESDDDSGDNYNFMIEEYLEAGNTYLLMVRGKCDEPSPLFVSVTDNYTGNHSYSEEAKVIAPTCTEEGYTTKTCVNCGYEDMLDITDALGHNDVNGTCTRCGTAITALSLNKATKATVIDDGDNHYFWYSFTPSADGTYYFYSDCESDPYATLYSQPLNTLRENDDGGDDYNFLIEAYLEAGQTYLLKVRGRSDEGNLLFVAVTDNYTGCHTYSQEPTVVAPTCAEDGYTERTCVNCAHSDKSDFKEHLGHNIENDVCTRCGTAIYGLNLNQPIMKSIETDGETHTIWYSFTPETDGTYYFSSDSTVDTNGTLFSQTTQQLNYNDDGGDNYNFLIEEYLEAGNTYLLMVSGRCDENGSIIVAVSDSATDCHDFADAPNVYPSTCTDSGYTEKICSHCRYYYQYDFTAPTGHNVENGVCKNCGIIIETLRLNELNKAEPVDDGMWTDFWYAFTPETDGNYYFYSDSDISAIGVLYNQMFEEYAYGDSNGDDYNFLIETYLEAGQTYMLRVSSSPSENCPLFIAVTDSFTGYHTYSDETTVVEPGCTNNGYNEKVCVNCSHRYQYDFKDPLGHVVENGVCTRCEKAISTLILNEPHKSTEDTNGQMRSFLYCFTPTTAGTYYFFSDSAFDPNGTLYDNSGHELAYNDDGGDGLNFLIEADLEAGQIYHLEVYGEVSEQYPLYVTVTDNYTGCHGNLQENPGAAPSCTDCGYTSSKQCTRCGLYVEYSEEIPALGHNYGAWKQTKAPTCTAKGTEAKTCTRCNASETRDIASLGHNIKHHAAKAATCTAVGWQAYDTCTRCNYTTYKEIAATGHHHDAVVTAPTCTAKGYTTHTCACGGSYVDSYTNALGHNYKNGKCTRCGAADPNYKPAPKAPELKITTSAGHPKIYWNAVDGATKYWIYRSTDGTNFSYYDKTNNTSYTNNSTTIGTLYYYKVKAVKTENGKDYASDYSVARSIRCKPAAPAVSINRSNGKPKLSWKAVTGATKYWIYRSTDGTNFKYFDSTTKLSYTNSGAASGTKYYYYVKAVAVVNSKNVVSAESSTKSLFTSLAKPSVSITTSNGKPKLTWKAVTGADKYYVYRSTDGKTFSYWDSTTKTSYVNSGAKKNTKYYYKVKAVCASNSNANSAQSSAVSIKATK